MRLTNAEKAEIKRWIPCRFYGMPQTQEWSIENMLNAAVAATGQSWIDDEFDLERADDRLSHLCDIAERWHRRYQRLPGWVRGVTITYTGGE